MRSLVVPLLALAVLPAAASAPPAHVRGPWPLVSLAALGTVTWRCDPARHPGPAPGLPALALGFSVARFGQTGKLRLTVGGRTVKTFVTQPGRVYLLPFLRTRTQQLDISASGEDGTLRARVTVTFAAPRVSAYCWPYMPPTTSVALFQRR
jgi:hypothetical protein